MDMVLLLEDLLQFELGSRREDDGGLVYAVLTVACARLLVLVGRLACFVFPALAKTADHHYSRRA
jgi:hypothetical protein